MAVFHPLAFTQLLLLASLCKSASAFHNNNARLTSFIGTPSTITSRSPLKNVQGRQFAQPWQSTNPRKARKVSLQLQSKSPLADTEENNTTTSESINNTTDELTNALESNNLQTILSYLQSHPSSIPSLSAIQIQAIFDAVEIATAETDENTVNKRAIEDANIISATSSSSSKGAAVEFRSLDRVRAQMTKLYQVLREEGKLNVFGAIARPPPSSSSSSSSQLAGPIYPTAGSKLISPDLLEKITEMSMTNLTPRPTNLLLYGGGVLALLEGIISLNTGINFNFLVVTTLLLAMADQLLVSGAVFETGLRMVLPEMTTRITKHEAGHFLCAYLLGCPVEGVVLSTWAALQDGRFGGRSGSAVSAGTSYYDLDLSEQIAGMKPLTRESIDRYSIIVMGGIAAEAMEYGAADGGAGDEEALVRFLRSLNPRGGNAVRSWTPELIRNQARWGAMQAVLMMKEYKPCYDALVDALERGGDLGQCVVAIEDAAKREGLGFLRKPLGMVVDDGEFGKWVPIDEMENDGLMGGEPSQMTGNNGNHPMASTNGVSSIPEEKINGVPTYGEDHITSTEQFLQQYREAMEKKLKNIDEQLEELDNKASNK